MKEQLNNLEAQLDKVISYGPAKNASISSDSLVIERTTPTRWPGVNPSSFMICTIRFNALSEMEK